MLFLMIYRFLDALRKGLSETVPKNTKIVHNFSKIVVNRNISQTSSQKIPNFPEKVLNIVYIVYLL